MSTPVLVSDVLPDLFEHMTPRATALGMALLSCRAVMGWSRTLRLAPWIVYGESLPVRDEARRAA